MSKGKRPPKRRSWMIPACAMLLLNAPHLMPPAKAGDCTLERTYSASDIAQILPPDSGLTLESGGIQVRPPPPMLPYFNVACSGRGMMARVDVNTGMVVGEYRTAPEGRPQNPNPSRTTVDHYGSTWIANRDDNGPVIVNGVAVEMGSITRIAVLTGGLRCDANGEPDPDGEYLTEVLPDHPFTYCSVGPLPNGDWTLLDRDDDHKIHTSKGLGNALGWDHAGTGGNDVGGVDLAEDELIINYTRVAPTGVRTLAVDRNNDLWVGGTGNYYHEKISGSDGQRIAGTEFHPNCGGYGGLIDHQGVLWSATGPLRYDPSHPETAACTNDPNYGYGIAIDPNTGIVWMSNAGTGYQICQLNPQTGRVHNTDLACQCYDQGDDNFLAQGIAVDCDSHVWVAEMHGTKIAHHAPIPGDQMQRYYFVGYVESHRDQQNQVDHSLHGTTGVAVGSDGYIWVTEGVDSGQTAYATKIDPREGEAGLYGHPKGKIASWVSLDSAGLDPAHPYNYSDMTGFVGRQTLLAGTATVLRDSGVRGVTWGSIAWNNDPNTCPDPEPPGTGITVRARAADEQEDLSSQEYVPVQKDQALPDLSGRFLEIEVTLAARQCGEQFTSPLLCDLTVRLAGGDCDGNIMADACEVLGGTADDCNGNGVLDSCELPNHDCNGNHLLDECDIREGRSNDCNHNGVPDECDIDPLKGGSSPDLNGNTIPDECEGCAPGVVFDASNFSLQGSVNITTDESGNLQLDPPALLYPFINIACSDRGTVARIFIGSADGTVPPRIIGEYKTTPDGVGANPSRTTVDRYGNVWVANRDDSSGGKGSITRVGVIVNKTTHEWVDDSHRYVRNPDGTYTQNNAGEYIKLDDTLECTCQDRHGATIYDPPDGYIKTSMGGYIDSADNVLPWRAEDCLPDDIDPVRLAEDECIINYTKVLPTGTRTLALDANNDVWVGGTGNLWHEKISGVTGKPLGISFNVNCGGYGGLIDQHGVLWSARTGGTGLLRFDVANWNPAESPVSGQDFTCFPWENYGLGLDPVTGWIWYSEYTGTTVHALDPLVLPPLDPRKFQMNINMHAKGLAVDCRRHVWIAEGDGTQVVHLAPVSAGSEVYYMVGAVGATEGTGMPFEGTTGAAVDANGKIWVSEKGGNAASRINPLAGPTDQEHGNSVGAREARVPLGPGAGPYNYGDMTGFVSQQSGVIGTWTARHNGGVYGARWDLVSWNTSCEDAVPPGTQLEVWIRAANTQVDLDPQPYVRVESESNGVPLGPDVSGITGLWVEAQVKFLGRRTCDGTVNTPKLCNLTLTQHEEHTGCESECRLSQNDCNGNHIADDCDIASGYSADCNQNGRPDECEPDCNGTGIPDDCDIRDQTSADLDLNGQPDECQIGRLFVGTRAGGLNGLPGASPAKVYQYTGGSNWTDLTPPTLTPPALAACASVRDLIQFKGHLYAAVQTAPGQGGGFAGQGQVWRYDGTPGNWTQVGDPLESLGTAVTALEELSGALYAATENVNLGQGGLYRLDGAAWTSLDSGQGGGFSSALATPICGTPGAVFLATRSTGGFWRYDPTNGLVRLDSTSLNISVSEFALYADTLYAAAQDNLWAMPSDSCQLPAPSSGQNWFAPLSHLGFDHWATAGFRGYLYVGGGEPGACGSQHMGAKLWVYEPFTAGGTWIQIGQWPSTVDHAGVTVMAAQGDRYLFIGLGLPDGYFDYSLAGYARGEVWRFDGSEMVRLGRDLDFGGGVQSLLVVGGQSTDCNGNSAPDQFELSTETDTNANGVLDVCEPNTDGDGIPSEIDNCPLVYNPDQADADGDGQGDACERSAYDFDQDGDVDQTDFGILQTCFTGPGGGLLPGCFIVDADCDGDVDTTDLDLFMACWSGPNILASTNCGQAGGIPNDSDGDGVPNSLDNCPTTYNPYQTDSNANGIGDACEPPPAPPAPPDEDSDGVPDAVDNCPLVANPYQEDLDGDGLGDACDPDIDNDGLANEQDDCPSWFNPNQADADQDGVGDECDPCPQVYDPDQANQDGDWWNDACDNCPSVWNYFQQDADADGVGDACDNCPDVYNPDQADSDSDGIGDACEEQGQGMMMFQSESLLESGLGSEGVTAYFVQHGTGASSVTLPAEGGTVVVDLVISGNAPILAFSAKPAVSASGVVSLDATGWTEQANALVSLGNPGTTLASFYNFGVLDWSVAIPSPAALEQTPRPTGVGVETGRSLSQLTGPYAGEAFAGVESLTSAAGALNVQSESLYMTPAPLGGYLRIPLPAGPVAVATLTLQVSAAPGTYTLSLAEAAYSTSDGQSIPMNTGTLLTITVQAP